MANINDADQAMLDVVEEYRNQRRETQREKARATRYRESKMPRGKAPVNIVHETLKKNGLL